MRQRYEVEWCTNLPITEDGSDFDNATFEVENLGSFEAATEKAKKVLPLDQFGSVRITRQIAELDEYITADIGRPYYRWEDVAVLYVDETDYEYVESEMERA